MVETVGALHTELLASTLPLRRDAQTVWQIRDPVGTEKDMAYELGVSTASISLKCIRPEVHNTTGRKREK